MTRVLLLLFPLVIFTHSAKILGVFPAPGYSQYILAEVLMTELANKGHEVTVISPFQPKNAPKNYKTILTEEIIKPTTGIIDLFELASQDLFTNIKATYLFGYGITEQTMEHPKVQELLHSDQQFDVVVVEEFFNDAMKGFATHFKAPLVLFTSMGPNEWNKEYLGNPDLPSLHAGCYTSFTNHMKFFQRIKNLAGSVYNYLYKTWVSDPIQEGYLKKYFPEPMDFQEVIHNASLMLYNSHVTSSESVLLPYNMIEVGGFHVIQNPLDKDVQEFLDGAKDGAILFSLGSNLRSSELKEETLNAIFTVFGKLKQKVLWKFEKDIPNKPKNLYISKWLKQKDILAHPNVKLFITHGGLLSTIEGIYHGVPMVGIPVFADQKMNMARAQRHGIAISVPFIDLSLEKLDSAVTEVLNNPKYQSTSKKMSQLMKDRPVKPLDLAVYWIEYAIRHKGMKFDLASLRMSWIQIYMLDILAFAVLNIVILAVALKSAICFVKKLCPCKNKTKTKQQ